ALLREYIDSLLEAIPAAPRSFCENPAVNAVVSYYAARLEDEGVEVRIRLSLPARLEGVTDGEACVVFGNLLENAMEACALVEVGPRFVHLDGEISRGVLAVTMGNSFDGRTFREGGRFRSSKRAEPGVGLSSIQAVARKHGGDARFEADGAVFRSSVYLQAAAAE
uniref:ATP-binding protein n=1 Tax=Candidatus Scatomorpha intestinigallinarum TaxID=2840923 RepID=UPI004025E6D4